MTYNNVCGIAKNEFGKLDGIHLTTRARDRYTFMYHFIPFLI
jgi:hypothetical protein